MSRALAIDASGKLVWSGKARGVHKHGEMNRGEAMYSQYLAIRKQAGDIQDFWFEAITLKLAHDTRLTVDFFVMGNDCTLTCVDVKGKTTSKRKDGSRKAKAYTQEDARIKLHVAAKLFPFRFVTAYLDKGTWVEDEVK
jgi:hypothetical protein